MGRNEVEKRYRYLYVHNIKFGIPGARGNAMTNAVALWSRRKRYNACVLECMLTQREYGGALALGY